MANRENIPLSVRDIVSEIKSSLQVTNKDIAQMHGVSPTTVKRWFQGSGISEFNFLKLHESYIALGLIREIILPERLPVVIRRPAESLLGRTAMDLIREGKITQIAEHYNDITRYSEGNVWRQVFEQHLGTLSKNKE